MNISQICIVLCNPDESRNIGSVCRAMKNMGISKLRIVGKRTDYDDTKVRVLAIHASHLWDEAVFYDSIKDATTDCILVAGTTRRRGKKRKNWLLSPEEFVQNISETQNGQIAIVFGNERTGLTDVELTNCTIGITIPSNPKSPSLNLSHAVQIICYELYKNNKSITTGYTPISLERLDNLIKTITDNQQKIGFFSVTGRPDMESFWRSILSRAVLSEGEAKYLEKIFTKSAGLISKTKT